MAYRLEVLEVMSLNGLAHDGPFATYSRLKVAEPALIPMRALRCSYWQRRTRPRDSRYGSVPFFRIDI